MDSVFAIFSVVTQVSADFCATLRIDMVQNPREFRSADLRSLLGVDPHGLRGLLALEPLASRERSRRSATAFTALDALFLAVMNRLHQLGFAPKALQGIGPAVHAALQKPVVAKSSDELRFHQSPNGTLALGEAPRGSSAIELVVPMPAVRLQLLRFTGADQIVGQGELALLSQLSNIGTARQVRS